MRGAASRSASRQSGADASGGAQRLHEDQGKRASTSWRAASSMRAWIGVRRGRRLEARGVGDGTGALQRLLLKPGVEAEVDRTLRLRSGQPPGAQERLGDGGHARRLVVQLHVVADLRALHQRGVDPVDPRPATRGVHGARRAEHEDGRAVAEGVEDRHARVLQADDVVDDRGHRPALRLRVAVGEGDGDLLVGGEDQLGSAVAAVVDEGVVQPAVGRAGIQGHVLDADRAQEVDDEVGAVSRRGSPWPRAPYVRRPRGCQASGRLPAGRPHPETSWLRVSSPSHDSIFPTSAPRSVSRFAR